MISLIPPLVDGPFDWLPCRSIQGDILEQYEKTVRPMHQLFVEPSKVNADLVVSGASGADIQALMTALVNPSTPRNSSLKGINRGFMDHFITDPGGRQFVSN